jgi:outer membrane protein OmpA-like peptidoglycan-associated protein
MLKATPPSSASISERKKRWRACRLGIMAALLGLVACNPIETLRDWTGASQNDPDPETTPNKANLAAGEAADFPNLATVPPPPVQAMTAAEREKLTQNLIADRANARYSNEQLRAGFSASAAPPPPPASSASAAEPQGTESGTIGAVSAPSPASAPPPSVSPTAPVASATPKPPSKASTADAAPSVSPTAPVASTAPKPPSKASTADAVAGDKSATQSGSAATQSTQANAKAPSGPRGSLRKQGEAPEPAPMESSLEVPQARATPQPEQIERAPPPPAQMPAPPTVASTAGPLPGGLSAGGALARTPLPQAKAAAGFEPAPAAPELPPPPAPTRAAAAEPGKDNQKPPPAAVTPVAEIKFAADSTSLTEGDRRKLETVVPLYRQSSGKVRVVGYAEAASGAVEQLNGYRAALDRAQAVAAALTKAGIPSDKIQVEAAPAGTNSGESRAEVLLEH